MDFQNYNIKEEKQKEKGKNKKKGKEKKKATRIIKLQQQPQKDYMQRLLQK